MRLADDLKALCEKAQELGASGTAVVDVPKIKAGVWTRMKCQYGCPNYGSNLCCPPYTPDYDQMKQFLAEYQHGVLVEYTFAIDKNAELDFAKIDLSMSNNLLDILLAVEKEAFFRNHYRAFALKAGRCRLCEQCNLQKCIHPVKARPSLEACGIDVFALANDNGFAMKVLTGPVAELNIYGLVLVE